MMDTIRYPTLCRHDKIGRVNVTYPRSPVEVQMTVTRHFTRLTMQNIRIVASAVRNPHLRGIRTPSLGVVMFITPVMKQRQESIKSGFAQNGFGKTIDAKSDAVFLTGTALIRKGITVMRFGRLKPNMSIVRKKLATISRMLAHRTMTLMIQTELSQTQITLPTVMFVLQVGVLRVRVYPR